MLVVPALLACLASVQDAPRADLAFGMSTALSGPTGRLGQAVRVGVQAAFDERNAAGGIDGANLALIALDDKYEPERTGPNIRTLAERDCLAVIGNVGTPTAVAALPICRETGMTLFASFTGASLLRKTPPDPYVVNYRASYAEETAAMVDALVTKGRLKPEEIAFFTQRDAYGDAGYEGGINALRKHGLKSETAVAHGRYERNTLNVENALADLLAAPVPPKAVIMVGTSAPCAKFLRLAGDFRLAPIFLSVSFVSATQLASDAGDAAEGVIVTEVVPHPASSAPAAGRYRDALKKSAPDVKPSHASFEGYLAGRTLILALERTSPPLTRAKVADALTALGEFDIGVGTPLSLTKEKPQASHGIWPSVIQKGEVREFDWASLTPVASAEAPR